MTLTLRSLVFPSICVLVATLATPASRTNTTGTTALPSPPEQFATKRSSGLFSLPYNAKSVDWAVVNDGVIPQTIRVTVFRCPIGAQKVPVAPGPLTVTLAPNFVTHNANPVGVGKPFVPGFYYEVVVETNDLHSYPSVQIWQDNANTAIPGTLIPAGDFVPVS